MPRPAQQNEVIPQPFRRSAAEISAGCHRARVTRRQALTGIGGGVLGSVVFGAASVQADDVNWLADVIRSPKSVPRDKTGYLAPLLATADGQPIHTLAEWKKRRRELRAAWMKFLGPLPTKRPPLKLKVLSEQHVSGCVRQRVRYDSEPGLPVEGYLLRPDTPSGGRKRAGVVALHATTRLTIDQIAGVAGRDSRQIGLKLARRGFVVFCPRNFLWRPAGPGEGTTYLDAVRRFKKRHPRTLGMHKMLYDAMRGVDVLASLADVDHKRIGACGHSLGGKETLYLAAFDERIRAAVASEAGIGFRYTNWDAPWYLGKTIHADRFPLNHHQLVALIAPRPFLLLAGESGSRGVSDGDRSWPFLETAHPICRLYGKPIRIGMFNHHRGHDVPPAAFRRMAEWLETYLDGLTTA